jgi:hypothetical protein
MECIDFRLGRDACATYQIRGQPPIFRCDIEQFNFAQKFEALGGDLPIALSRLVDHNRRREQFELISTRCPPLPGSAPGSKQPAGCCG